MFGAVILGSTTLSFSHVLHLFTTLSLDKEVDCIELNLFVCSRQNSLWLLSLRMFLSDTRWPCPQRPSSTATKSGRCMQSFLWLRRYDRVNKTFTTQWTDRVHTHTLHLQQWPVNLKISTRKLRITYAKWVKISLLILLMFVSVSTESITVHVRCWRHQHDVISRSQDQSVSL